MSPRAQEIADGAGNGAYDSAGAFALREGQGGRDDLESTEVATVGLHQYAGDAHRVGQLVLAPSCAGRGRGAMQRSW